MKNAVNNLM